MESPKYREPIDKPKEKVVVSRRNTRQEAAFARSIARVRNKPQASSLTPASGRRQGRS